jgi:hypothetical protein
MGIQMITVASSGVNKKTEYLFRAMTLITNGTYVAITNHSNVGDEHIESNSVLKRTLGLGSGGVIEFEARTPLAHKRGEIGLARLDGRRVTAYGKAGAQHCYYKKNNCKS